MGFKDGSDVFRSSVGIGPLPALQGLEITWHASYGGVEHEGLLAPVGGACGVGRCAEQDVVVGGILLTATELDVKEAAEALHRSILKHVHAEVCLLHSSVRVLLLGAPGQILRFRESAWNGLFVSVKAWATFTLTADVLALTNTRLPIDVPLQSRIFVMSMFRQWCNL